VVVIDPAAIFANAGSAENKRGGGGQGRPPARVIEREIARLPVRSPEELQETQELVIKLNRYFASRFKDYLQGNGLYYSPARLRDMEYKQLQDIYAKVKVTLANKNDVNLVQSGVMISVRLVEQVTQKEEIKGKLDLNGLSTYLASSEEFQDALCQLQLENGIVTAFSPTQRLLWAFVKAAVVINGLNQRLRQPAPQPDQQGQAGQAGQP
jgi:hypothetical protein